VDDSEADKETMLKYAFLFTTAAFAAAFAAVFGRRDAFRSGRSLLRRPTLR
jgi:hypothetical protein